MWKTSSCSSLELQRYFRGEVFWWFLTFKENLCRVLLQLCQEFRSFQNLLEQLLEVQQSNPFWFCSKSFSRASPRCCFISFPLGHTDGVCTALLNLKRWEEPKLLLVKSNYRENSDCQVCQIPASSAGTDLVPAGINGMLGMIPLLIMDVIGVSKELHSELFIFIASVLPWPSLPSIILLH